MESQRGQTERSVKDPGIERVVEVWKKIVAFFAHSWKRQCALQDAQHAKLVSLRGTRSYSATTEKPQPCADEEDTPEPKIWLWGSTLDLLNPLTEPPLMAQALSSPSPAKGSGEAIMAQPSGDIHGMDKHAMVRMPPMRTSSPSAGSSPSLTAVSGLIQITQCHPYLSAMRGPGDSSETSPSCYSENCGYDSNLKIP
ncbi:unnamed protein product [Pleuronectes platessa]|uniref:Uncharacterized protein n=1 Tax=Pleuronectes platessa TaxID=8262 RepID=A0A9N7UB68_PLEPL|nr:unnamed protein product [Pleuronectes platessa]